MAYDARLAEQARLYNQNLTLTVAGTQQAILADSHGVFRTWWEVQLNDELARTDYSVENAAAGIGISKIYHRYAGDGQIEVCWHPVGRYDLRYITVDGATNVEEVLSEIEKTEILRTVVLD
jgi:hypothetical protein